MPDLALAAAPPNVDRFAIRRDILMLAWPVVLQSLMRTAMFLTDTYMLGLYGTHGLAAVALVGPVAHTISMVLAALATGTLATVARASGAKDRALQEQEAATSVAVGTVAGFASLALVLPVFPLLGRLLVVPDNPAVSSAGIDYLWWTVLAIPFMLLESTTSSILRAAGDTRTPMFLSLLANVMNLVGNYMLIFGKFGAPRMGVAGAGLSTAIALMMDALLLMGWLFMPWSAIRLRMRSFLRVTVESVRRLVRVSLPAAVEPILIQVGFLIFIGMLSRMGQDALAAHRVAVAVESISFMPGWGLAVACGAIVGQYLGARRPDKAAAGLRESVILCGMMMGALGIVFALFAAPMARFFIRDAPEVARAAGWCLRIASVEQLLMAVAMVLGGALRGAGDTKSPVLVAMLGVWVVRVPLTWLLAVAAGMGVVGAWLVMVVDWSARAAVFAWVWRRGRWKSIRL
ncbi:MAG: MATE family efflux transporter [Planctomycetes bacterium]|nr:MATE family efflux transporter [Planctomycetota bacterium]